MVGYGTSDDAGIYRLDDETALVTTADFITPPVDDPFLFGQIAAANALSDVYAMGGRPITCLNLAAFPSKKLAPELLHGIVEGALSKISEAGAVLAGGHTIEDSEPKFGLAVTGLVHPKKFWPNNGARPGDVLILTKPIGSGVLFNANLKGWVSEPALADCISTLTTLNKVAAEVMADFTIHAVTDVTGFGLAGHALEMARGAGVCFELMMDRVPTMDQALEMYIKGVTTGMNAPNRRMVEKWLRFEKPLSDRTREILYDPQTSGGLLVSLPENQGEALCRALTTAGFVSARCIGRVKKWEKDCFLVFK